MVAPGWQDPTSGGISRVNLHLTTRTPVWHSHFMRCDQAMSGLHAAVAAFRNREHDSLTASARGEELRELRAVIDALEIEFSFSARRFQAEGGHLADGAAGAVSWLARNCNMTAAAAADRVCVGKQLQSLPEVAKTVGSGEIGYQSTAAVCHLYEQLGDRREALDESALVEHVRQMRVNDVRVLCHRLRHVVDPDGAERSADEDFERRWLKLSPLLDGMFTVDGVLDAVGGAAVKKALESLCTRQGDGDTRRHGQRMADAIVELAHHALDNGRLPATRGAKPHVSMTTTLEGLRGVAGSPAAELDAGVPIPARTFERMACDCTITRVLMADSMVIDVGRATRVIPPATRRALQARDRCCRWPGCDRPIGWTSAHHIEFWSRGGATALDNLLSLCHFHHRLVHEGGWQVVKVGGELRFIAPPPKDFVPWRARHPSPRGWEVGSAA